MFRLVFRLPPSFATAYTCCLPARQRSANTLAERSLGSEGLAVAVGSVWILMKG